MTIDDWRARYGHLSAETDRLRAEVERLRENQERAQYRLAAVEAERDAALVEVERLRADAERARWCEDNYANVFWSVSGQYWFCEVPRSPKAFTQYFREATRNAAIDAARGKA